MFEGGALRVLLKVVGGFRVVLPILVQGKEP